ncbi:hypothetical protein [Mycobacteroides abscessus]|uniref:hypothetical protein n=1 Tax=Mycobacteroides abscessus TaxID=36809 RepID=UPI0002E255E0|nr:hypothetical protein [Mycobacteroides abscessus]MDO2969911.1 hypothetical protein [Mycobacteroides abscessus subsp. bolletii]MDO3079913.1 hypothetical protein [Mycobacteroides abscessus subsp. bolletii]SKK68301.1 Uncharacterised protein [Mycobacteroides abscessus subsp. bolletii]
MTSEFDVSPYECFYPLLPEWAQQEYQATIADNIEYMEGLKRGEFLPRTRRPDLQRWITLAHKTARLCDNLLRQLSPQAALTACWVQLPDDLLTAVGDAGSLNRFRWVLATSATGESIDVDLLKNFLRRAGRWWGATVMINRHKDRDLDLSLAVSAAPERELMQRTSSLVIRFHWAAEMIATEICRQIQSDPEFATYLTDFTEHNMRGCFDSAVYYMSMLDAPPIPHNAPGMALAKHMSVRAGEAKMTFTQAVSSMKLESHPWVEFDQGLVPMATTSTLMAMDRALLTAAETALWRAGVRKHKITKGELFERAAQQCIIESLAFGVSTPPRESTIRLANSKPDVDVSIVADGIVQLVGEVKAMESADDMDSTDKNFREQIGKVHKQLTLCLDALTRGVPIIDGADGEHFGNADTIGLGIVLHPYGGTLGDPEMMEVLEPEHRHWRVATAELHSWILILSAMENIDELRDYLQFRNTLVELGVYFAEECDPALAFLEGQADRLLNEYRAAAAICPPERKFKPILNGIQADSDVSLHLARPTHWRQWREIFSIATTSNPYLYRR